MKPSTACGIPPRNLTYTGRDQTLIALVVLPGGVKHIAALEHLPDLSAQSRRGNPWYAGISPGMALKVLVLSVLF